MPNINQSDEVTEARRQARQLREADRVLEAMRAGAALQLQHTRSGPLWTLDGRKIAEAVAQLVIKSSSVTAMGDSLFAEASPQTWTWWQNAVR